MQNFDALPADLAAAHAMILAERAARLEAEAQISGAKLEIERLKLLLARARREQFGQTSERGRRLIDQLELQLSELEETAAEAEVAAEIAAASVERPPRAAGTRKPARRPLPEHLPRERILYAAPCTCPRCGGPVRKLGEDVTETLECVPRRWKVVEHVREKVSCRCCEAISQPPAPSHPIARGRAGPHLLALVLVAKYGQQSAADPAEHDLRPGRGRDRRQHPRRLGRCRCCQPDAAGRGDPGARVRGRADPRRRHHGPGPPAGQSPVWGGVPVLAKEKTKIGRLWAYVRDDRPFAGPAPPAAAFFYSPDRSGEHPERHLTAFAGIMQADAYAGFNRLYEPGRQPGPILEAACWAHARRKLYDLAAVAKAPIAAEAVRRIEQLFAVERDIAGLSAEARLTARAARSAPILADLEPWLRHQLARLSRRSEVGKAIAYTTKRWATLTRFISDGRICMNNNAAERALRSVAVGRHNWTFAGSDRGGERAAAVYTPIETAKLNGVDPQAWLADALARLPDHPARRIEQLLPWRWVAPTEARAAA